MHIARLKIQNILGITELELTPEGFNEITGPNGTGKTSVLEAIKAAISGGNDATLLRKGADKGEIVLVLDDDTEVRKKVTAKSSTTDVIRDGKKVPSPGNFIKDLTDMLSVNPVDFLRAPKKDRVKVLLEAMPLVADAAHLTKISGIPVADQPNTHALQVIKAVHQQVYDDRTGTNRAVKEKDATINQLRLALPEEAAGGVDGSEEELIARIAAADSVKEAELERIRTKLDGIKKDNQSKVDAIRAETQAKIDKIKAEAQAEVDSILAEERRIEGLAAGQREKAIKIHTDTVSPIGETLASIRMNRSNIAKRAQALDTIQKLEKELEDLKQDAANQTNALEDIEAYKQQLLQGLPIPGVEIIDGEIYRDGVQFDRLNTAQQVEIAVEIAILRAGELKLACVDGLELLDTKTFEAFRERALESGLQLFVTRVSDEEFGVRTSS